MFDANFDHSWHTSVFLSGNCIFECILTHF